ncbi:hypothetical protein ACJ5NV_00570 [Loktanella agnita]|uniref:hypothetical protein n=1 Tax=Loktanella agnita TaxID=287097 RepID=UPI003986CC2A
MSGIGETAFTQGVGPEKLLALRDQTVCNRFGLCAGFEPMHLLGDLQTGITKTCQDIVCCTAEMPDCCTILQQSEQKRCDSINIQRGIAQHSGLMQVTARHKGRIGGQ